jgi:hypothetical protein
MTLVGGNEMVGNGDGYVYFSSVSDYDFLEKFFTLTC